MNKVGFQLSFLPLKVKPSVVEAIIDSTKGPFVLKSSIEKQFENNLNFHYISITQQAINIYETLEK